MTIYDDITKHPKVLNEIVTKVSLLNLSSEGIFLTHISEGVGGGGMVESIHLFELVKTTEKVIF